MLTNDHANIIVSIVRWAKNAKLHASCNGQAMCGAGKIIETHIASENEAHLICRKCAKHFDAPAGQLYQYAISDHRPNKSRIAALRAVSVVCQDIMDGGKPAKPADKVERYATLEELEAQDAAEYEAHWNARFEAASREPVSLTPGLDRILAGFTEAEMEALF